MSILSIRKVIGTAIFLFISYQAQSQQGLAPSNFSGYFEANGQYYQADSAIDAPEVREKYLNNGFMVLNYNNGNLTAGIRYESYLNTLLGFDPSYKGNGITNRYVSYSNDFITVTAGNFYEQFGSGLVFRTYWEPNLGLDNSLDGLKVVLRPRNGITFKGVIGRQRDFFTYPENVVRGIDGEIQINDVLEQFANSKLRIGVGGSFVSKYQKDDKPSLILPENVGAYAGRINLRYGKIAFDAEYAYKINDPSQANLFTYNTGEALFTNLTYTQKGLGIRLSGKRVSNMDYRSDRSVTGTRLQINYLPAVNRQQTYRLATLYPFATQSLGEMGGSSEIYYNFKPKSALGGEYGTTLMMNYAAVSDIDRKNLDDTLGYTSEFFSVGDDRYYQEVTFEVTKKISKKSKVIVSYLYQIYDREKIEGKVNEKQVTSHLGVIEYTYKFSSTNSIRFDVEHLSTEQDRGNWAMFLVEFNMAPHWTLTAFDEWNYGNKDPKKQFHYYNGSINYVKDGTRISLSWARQRAGLLCVGGVCRFVPASNGLSLTVSSRF
ncbi:MAG: hypothetical protein KBA99_03710 [Bacteroidia bacterium]|nr:hypothetical protein [Bacteroidota bacterium]MBP7244397.1 hypothetical protein [Bacteroidia bacterium]